MPAAASPTTQSPDYVQESNPEADPEDDDDEDPEEDPAPSAEEIEPFETDESAATPPPHPAYRVTARISILAPVPTLVWSDAEIPSLPLPLIQSLSLLLSPPLPVSSPVSVLSPSPPASLIHPFGYRAAMIRLRAEATSTSHSLPLPPPIILSHTGPAAPSSGTPPMHLLSIDRREDRPEVTLPARKRLGITLGPAYEGDHERDVEYGIIDSWDKIVETMQGAPDTNEIYTRLDDEQSGRQLLASRLNMLFRERPAHARTARHMKTEARISREAWGRSMDASDLARVEVMSLRTTMLAQQSQIRELQSADRRRQTVISEILAADHRRQKQVTEALKLIKRLQTQMAEFEREQGPAKGPT
ncbi:hypothetical protein Tco_1152364 [Tanacetum coccineum]